MKEDQFIKSNSATWKELEDIYIKINKKGIKTVPSQEVKRFLHVFRVTSHNLAYANTHYGSNDLTTYLNSLIGKCHSYVYAVKKVPFNDLVKYLIYGFPSLLKEYKAYLIASFLFFALGVIISLLLVLFNSNNALMFLPQSIVEGTKAGQSSSGTWNYPLMASYIMTNNITVALKAFIMGITFGLGTIYTLFFNGTMLGALTSITYLYGDPIRYWSLILPHGIIEITAIVISGAAGLLIAKSMLIPGELSRKYSLIAGCKKAVSLIIGIIFMLIIAGIIEGFFTPLNIMPITKLIFAGITGILLLIYFCIPYFIKR